MVASAGKGARALCLIFLLLSQEALSRRAAIEMTSAIRHAAAKQASDTITKFEAAETAFDVATSPDAHKAGAAVDSAAVDGQTAVDGEAVRGRLQYWAHHTWWKGARLPGWKTAIVVLASSGKGNGEAELRFYEDEPAAAKLFTDADHFPKDGSVKPKHIVTIPNDRLATVSKSEELKIHVDTEAAYQSKKWSRVNHAALVLRPHPSDPLEIQLRQNADPGAELLEQVAATKKDYLDAWINGLKSLQAVDTCLTASEPGKACHTQCTYVGHSGGFGGCFPSQFCVEEAGMEPGWTATLTGSTVQPVPTCKAVEGEAKNIAAWNALLDSVKSDLDTVKNCFTTCKAEWDRALRNSKFVAEFHDKMVKDPLKSTIKKRHPGLLRAVQGAEPDLQQIMASLAETFDKAGSSGMMSLALKTKGCTLRPGAMTELVAAQDNPDQMMPLLDEMMNDCSMIGKSSQDLAAEMDQEVTPSKKDKKKVQRAQANLAKMDEASRLAAMNAAGSSLVQRMQFGNVSNATSGCEAVCMAFLVGGAIGIAIGIFLIIFGRILCYLVMQLTPVGNGGKKYHSPEDQKAVRKYRTFQCATYVNRVATVFMIGGAVAVVIGAIMVCSQGGCDGGGGGGSSYHGGGGYYYPSYYWMWWGMPHSPVYVGGYDSCRRRYSCDSYLQVGAATRKLQKNKAIAGAGAHKKAEEGAHLKISTPT